VHQIQSGQVIVDLCSVVKELVENSLDAGATIIGECPDCQMLHTRANYTVDVRFKNQGLDSIEVQDNGDGISPQNYETVALKHYTSKLFSYSDLETLQTFGFRGEALSSLCALSHFSIITCLASDAPKGTKLEFEVSGKLKGTSTVAAQKGTTVIVENLFNNLPVRRRELEKNIKREWGRVTGVLGQYACIQTGIKFSVSQQAAKGKKTTLFSTKGNITTRDNIVNVFGAKTLSALVPLDLRLELEPTGGQIQKWNMEDGGKKDVRIIGHISRPVSGDGRQTPDRQMFFVNARPCGLPQVARAFNDVYKSYNASQSPFIFANIELDTHMYDVNVSPDKRTILLHDQTRMLDNLKTALTALFESQDYTVPVSQLPGQKQPSYKQLTINRDSAVPTQIPKKANEAADAQGPETGFEASSREPSVENVVSDKPHDTTTMGASVKDSTGRDRQAINLISTWMDRKTEHRADENPQSPEPANDSSPEMVESTDDKFDEESELPDLEHDTSRHDMSPRRQDSLSSRPVLEQDQNSSELQPLTHDFSQETQETVDAPIPALQSPSKLSSTISNVFVSSPRRQRPPPEVATITVGNHTMTKSIAEHSPKRPRINNGPSGSASKGRSKADGNALSSFGSRLSQRFAAPGTAQKALSSDGSSDADTQDVPPSPSSVASSMQDKSLAEDNMEITEVPSNQIGTEDEQVSSPSGESNKEEEYIDEDEKKAREEALVQGMIKAAEEAAAQPSEENATRAKALLKGRGKKKDTTLNLVKTLETDSERIEQQIHDLEEALSTYRQLPCSDVEQPTLESVEAEEKLSLTISKTDFAKMKIIGQFNLGFILATRSADPASESSADELFIIDQHASDEKYNFERLQATTIVQSQRLVQPKTLDLTALEEEIVIENKSALETNGFILNVDQSGEAPVGSRCQLVSLPLSREITFSLTDLDELLALLSEHPAGSVPRPSRVRKMFAMRACRSSIMIGKTLTQQQMGKVVRHLGELDKPWNCPHGRPTMRHLCGLGAWDESSWKEGTGLEGEETEATDWAAYVRKT
jgi:DNA mismatch repair protein PMS2